MPSRFELRDHALNLAQTATEAMSANAVWEPDDSTWGIACRVLQEAKRELQGNGIVQDLELSTKNWIAIRSSMQAVANALSAALSDERHTARLNRGLRMRRRRR
jgi:hypothetical protein